jgi:hypothetical protein
MEYIFGIAWVIVLGFIVKTFADYRLQKLIIDRKMVDENLSHLFKRPAPVNGLSSIKWGMVMIGIGLAFLAKQFWPYDFTDEGLAGLIMLMGGFGFILYYFIAKNIENK